MAGIILYNALIINEGRRFIGYVCIENEFITRVEKGHPDRNLLSAFSNEKSFNLEGKLLLPGIIDDQVHFRDPGLTHKGDIESESRCAVAGGVTSFMDMPNTKPPTTSPDAWEYKMKRAADVSYANYAFFPGATNDNLDFLQNLDFSRVPGIKVFLGSSTGNMLVDSEDILDEIFSLPCLIAVHSEDEEIIKRNKEFFLGKYPESVPLKLHPLIRSEEACYVSTKKAVERACRLGTRLHILHISTAKELSLINNNNISAEVCVHHLWFSDADYKRLGTLIKWNPAIKTSIDRDALRNAVNSGTVNIVATDHAPHLLSEKQGDAITAASGGPLLQHSLQAMLEMARQGIFSYEKIVETMSHNPALLYNIDRRGFIRSGYYADLTVVDQNSLFRVTDDNILSKCGWSPFKGQTFSYKISHTFVNGRLTYLNENTDEVSIGKFLTKPAGHALLFRQSPR